MNLSNVTAAAASLWRAQKRELVASFGGTSMRPAIEPGEELRIRCGADPERGDVVFLVVNGQPVVHRVVAVTSGGVWTRGDANFLPDGFVKQSDVVGVVEQISRAGEWRSVDESRARTGAALILLVSRAGGDGFVTALWRARSAVTRTALRLRRAFQRGSRGA